MSFDQCSNVAICTVCTVQICEYGDVPNGKFRARQYKTNYYYHLLFGEAIEGRDGRCHRKKSSSLNPMTLNHRNMKRFNDCSQGPRQKLFVKELGSQPPGEEMEHVSQSELANFAKLTTPKFQNICSLICQIYIYATSGPRSSPSGNERPTFKVLL